MKGMADFSRPGSLYGAIDLGARKQALEAQARRDAAGPQATSSASVVDVTEETFTTDVIDRSMTMPVVLDLWSPRAPGSAQLSPVLEKVVGDLGGKAILAKVNVDASPQIAQALRVQAVPTVLAIFQGQAVTGFQQVLPEQEVRAGGLASGCRSRRASSAGGVASVMSTATLSVGSLPYCPGKRWTNEFAPCSPATIGGTRHPGTGPRGR